MGTVPELMVHRRDLHDDGRGVGEALNETEPWDTNLGLRVLTNHAILLNADPLTRKQVEAQFNEPFQAFYTNAQKSKTSGNVGTELPAHFYAHWRPYDASTFVFRVVNVNEGVESLNVEQWLNEAYGKQFEVIETGLSENQSMRRVQNLHMNWRTGTNYTTQDKTDMEFDEDLLGRRHHREQNVTYEFHGGEVKSFFVWAHKNN
jgi:hypothetical protein